MNKRIFLGIFLLTSIFYYVLPLAFLKFYNGTTDKAGFILILAYGFFSFIVILFLELTIMSPIYYIYSNQPKTGETGRRKVWFLSNTLALSFTHLSHLYPIVQTLVIFSHLCKGTVGFSFYLVIMCSAIILRYNYWEQREKTLESSKLAVCHHGHTCFIMQKLDNVLLI